jgi:hypothetical protein
VKAQQLGCSRRIRYLVARHFTAAARSRWPCTGVRHNLYPSCAAPAPGALLAVHPSTMEAALCFAHTPCGASCHMRSIIRTAVVMLCLAQAAENCLDHNTEASPLNRVYSSKPAHAHTCSRCHPPSTPHWPLCLTCHPLPAYEPCFHCLAMRGVAKSNIRLAAQSGAG